MDEKSIHDLLGDNWVCSAERRIQAAEENMRSTVKIIGKNAQDEQVIGTGFFIDKDEVLKPTVHLLYDFCGRFLESALVMSIIF